MAVGDRKLAHVSASLLAAWCRHQGTHAAPLPAVPEDTWLEICRLRRLLARAQQVGLWLAAARLRRALSRAIDHQRQQLSQVRDQLLVPLAVGSAVLAPTASELYADLKTLACEFPCVSYRPSRGLLSVTTEPVELRQVMLGAFRIELSWLPANATLNATASASASAAARSLFDFEVVAVTPQPAGTSDCHPHPHIDGTVLCAGDGRPAMQLALKQLRLLDFFVLVRQVLTTYNPGSAYVTLDNWDGVECRDCGDTVNGTGACSCRGCDGMLCEDCQLTCDDCDRSFCADCSFRCRDCDHSLCSTCLRRCGDCGEPLCRKCLIDDNCFACDEKQETGKVPTTQDACA